MEALPRTGFPTDNPGRFDQTVAILFPFAEDALWTTRADGRVRLRLEPLCTQLPYTVHRMFYEALDKYGDLSALGFKCKNKWERISYYQYYLIARKVAKGFLKVGAPSCTPFLSPDLLSSLSSSQHSTRQGP